MEKHSDWRDQKELSFRSFLVVFITTLADMINDWRLLLSSNFHTEPTCKHLDKNVHLEETQKI